MARKKRLNRRVVVLLSIIGLFVVVGAVAYGITRLPKDVSKLIAVAKSERQNRNYEKAEVAYHQAIGAAQDNPVAADYAYDLATMYDEWLNSTVLKKQDAAQKMRQLEGALHKALLINPKHLNAQRMTTKITWEKVWYYDPQHRNCEYYIKDAAALLALDPQDHVTWYRKALANGELAKNLRGSYIDAARSDFKQAVSIKSDELNYWVSWALFEEATDPDKTEGVYTEAVKANPDKPEMLVAYAMYLIGKNRQQEGLNQMKKAQECDAKAGTCVGSVAMAEYYGSKQDPEPDKAMDILKSIKSAHPEEYRIYRDMAYLYSSQNKPAEAIAILEEGLKALAGQAATATSDPDKTSDAEILKRRSAEAHRAELNLLLANFELDQISDKPEQTIAKVRERISNVKVNAPDVARLVARINGRILFLEGKNDEAARILEDVFGQLPDPGVAYWLTQIYVRQQKPGKAEEMAKKLSGMGGPQRALAGLILQAQAQINYQAYDEAYNNIHLALQIDPKNPQALEIKTFLDVVRTATLPRGVKMSEFWTGQTLGYAVRMGAAGRMKEAIALVEDLHNMRKDDMRIVSELAILYMQANQEDKAQALLEETSKIVKDNKNIQQALETLREKDPQKRLELQLRDKSDLEKALIYARSGDKKKFEEYLGKAADKSPNDQTIIELQFVQALSAKEPNWAQAEDCAKRAAEVDAVMGKIYQARIAMANKKTAEAISLTQEALHDRPESKQIQAFAGEVYLAAGDVSKAEERFRNVISVDPGYGPGLVGLARVTERLGLGDEHDRLIERAYRIVPQDQYIQSEHSRIEDDRLKPDEAIRKREEARRAHPDDAQNLLRLANLYEKNKQIDQAGEIYRSIFDTATAADKLTAANMLLQFYTRNSMSNQIETVLNNLTNNPPDKVGAWVLYGQIRLTQDASEQARMAFEKAITIDPKDIRGLRAMAGYFGGQGKFAKAAQQMHKAVDLEGNSANRKIYAKYLIDSGDLVEAENQLEKVLTAEPKDAEAMSDKAVLLSKKGQTDQAEQLYGKAIEADPQYIDALIRRADLRLRIGNKDGARADLEAFRKKSTNPEQLRQAVVAYQRLGEKDTAIQILQQIRQKYNNYPPATLDLAQIYLAQKMWSQLDTLLNDAEKTAATKTPFYQLHAESYRQRNLSDKRIEKTDQAYQLQKDRTTAVDYALALIEGNALDKALVFTSSQKDDGSYGDLMKALQARALVQLKRADEADDLFKQALRSNNQADVVFALNQIEKAFGPALCFSKIQAWKDLWPQTVSFYVGFGQICSKLKTAEGRAAAVDVLTQARKMATTEQDKAKLDILLGTVYQDMNDLKKAEQMYLDSLKVLSDENAPQSLNNLAYMYANDMNKPAEGVKYAARALKVMPNDIDVLDTYGWAMVKAGQPNQAAEDALSRAVAGDNSPFICRYHLGYLYEKTGRRNEARTQYKAALDMAPAGDPMRKILQDSYDRVSN